MKRISKLIAALLLPVCLVFTGCPDIFAAETEEAVFRISSVEDLVRLSEKCRVNSWSDGLTVELDADLDLTGAESVGSIACFNGTFHGNSHTIGNLAGQSALFQTIGKDAYVSDLTITGAITSTRDNTAVFVSQNSGRLDNIKVEAQVTGKSTAGILAAVNTETGQINGCEVSGFLSGDNSVGGIAGKNKGVISYCVNRAHINTNVDDSSMSAEDVKDILENILLTKSINNTENLRVRIDTGGIAGYNMNSGAITGCTNEGIVGYPHNGFNTGGICGRTGGEVSNCVNNGRIYGRRGTGGITGKQQPEITLDFSQDVLSAMSDEMDGINSLITDTLNTSERITESTYDRLSGLSKSMTDVKNSTNVVYNASLERFDEAADTINSTADTITGSMDDIAADTEGLEDSFDTLSSMTTKIDNAMDDMAEGLSLTDGERGRIVSLNDQLRQDLNTTLPLVEEIRENRLPDLPEERRARINQALSAANRTAGDIRAMRTILTDLRSRRDRIADGSIQTEAVRRDRAMSSAVSEVFNSIGDLDDVLSELSSFSSSLGGSISDMAGGINIDLQANEAVRAAGDDIYAGLDSISSQIDSMNAGAREDSLEVIANMNEINRRFTRLTDLMENERDRLNDIADNGGIFNDTSDTVNSASRIVSCRNTADIDGDTQTGGIAGTIAVEYDLDPDKDILRNNSRSLDYSFGVSAAILDSENTGIITAKENHAGGIVGKADMGTLRKNTNEGDVSSEDGYFVGGISGYALASLDGNTARCRVTGEKNAGGICGYGKTLRDNIAAVTVLGTDEYAGTIAGNVDELDAEKIRNNIYYAGNFGAIDNIDYAGMAERAAEPMDTVLVKFKVNGHIVGLEEVKRGTVLKDVPVPETEVREGFYLRWDVDKDTVLDEDTVVDSVYCLLTSALSSKETEESSGKPLVIADGQFRDEDVLTFRSEGEWHYFVSVPDDGLTERKIRVLKPVFLKPVSGKPAARTIHVFVNGSEVKTETFGDYLTFPTAERELEILVTSEEPPYKYIAAAAVAVLILLAVMLIKKIRKKHSKKAEKEKDQIKPEKEETQKKA